MIRSVPEASERGEDSVGIEGVLKELVRQALRGSSDLLSITISDRQGLPIVTATKGSVPGMTYSAMATMALRAARTAAEAVHLSPPEYVVVHSGDGVLLILDCPGAEAALAAQLRPDANLGLALVVLQRLAEGIGAALREEK